MSKARAPAAPEPSVSAAPPAPPVKAPEPAAAATPPAVETKTPAPPVVEQGSSGMGWIIGIVVLVLAAGAVVVLVLRRRRRPEAAGAYDASGPRGVLRDLATPFADRAVGGKPLVIGRKAGTDPKREYLVLAETSVGRWHATIERRGLTFFLRDEGSVNGTFLNGERIKGEEALKHNDLIRIHSHNFQFLIPDLEDSDRTQLASR